MAEMEHRPPHQPLVAPGGIDHHIADLTVTASADLTLAALQEALGQHDQWLPIDGDPSASIGYLVESNSTGPLRLGFGGWRDLLLGAQFKAPSGALITAGGRTMKNVAGYDLTKFMVGQQGLFGRLVTLTARTYRKPSNGLLACFGADPALVRELLPSQLRPHWAMYGDGLLWLGYLGNAEAISFYHTGLERLQPRELRRHSIENDIAFRAAHWAPARGEARFRASVPPAKMLDFLDRAHVRSYAADAAFGIVVGACVPGERSVIYRTAHDLGGSALFDEAGSLLAMYTGPELELLARLRKAFGA